MKVYLHLVLRILGAKGFACFDLTCQNGRIIRAFSLGQGLEKGAAPERGGIGDLAWG